MQFTLSGSRLARLAAPAALLTLAACATPFKADVSRFQTQLPAPAGESFYVVADDPALAGGLEFAQYADYVEAELMELGYGQASSPEEASLLVRFDYGVGEGRERIRTTGFRRGFYDPFYDPWFRYSRFYGPVGYWGRPWGFGFYDPWFGGPEVRSYTVYNSDIELKIDRQATGERLFEGRAEALSRSDRLPYLVPNLVEAMFVDFPGNSGETLRISIKPEETTVRRID
jgi:hypothetical protein